MAEAFMRQLIGERPGLRHVEVFSAGTIASDGTAVLRFVGAKPRGLFGLPTRTLPEHLAWLATLPEAP